ncbi:glycosyltransferase family 2 protein [Hymenobacter sp.]|jgi:glycosyltransferase involved in cell wall biosynthesis|uniref:glycosyltransferase family 2 protein n=1 Tax=Hymenobacter sp. TaxID=1898978 RepID=UPI002ED89101
MHLVSIIIPCYNYGWLLAETLESVLAQSYPHWECLLIDDGSTDNSRTVAEEYQSRDARFQYHYQVNKGMSAARNYGIARAQGKYIQFLDADDLLAPQKLEIHAAFLEAHPNVDLVYGDVRCFRHGEPAKLSCSFDMLDTPWMPRVSGQGEVLINALIKKNIMAVNAALVRIELIQRVGLVAEDLRSVEDWEYWVRCAMAGAYFQYDENPNAWALVRVHPSSTSHNMLKMHEHEVKVRKKLNETLMAIGANEALEVNKIAIVKSTERVAMNDLLQGNSLAGIKRFLKLAYETGMYTYYLKSIPYGFKQRLKTLGKVS